MNHTSRPAAPAVTVRTAPRVLMLGTAPGGRGGVATVVSLLRQDGLFEREGVCYVPTHVEGTRATKLRTALTGLGRTLACLCRRPELVHAHAASHASFVRKSVLLALARLAGCKTVFHLHGGGFDRFMDQSGPLMRRWIRHTLQASSVVIALSERWAAYLRRAAPGVRVVVIPNSVPLPKLGQEQEEPGRILFLGKIETAKGIDDLLEALAAIAPRFPQARLAIGGQGELERVQRRAAELGVADRIEALGWIDGARKAQELMRAAIFCLPSHAEGLPMAMLEAMAAAKPVVVTAVGGIPDTVRDGDNGLLVPPRDVPALAAGLAGLLGDGDRRRRLGGRARATIEQEYESGVVIGRISAVYRQLRTAGGQ